MSGGDDGGDDNHSVGSLGGRRVNAVDHEEGSPDMFRRATDGQRTRVLHGRIARVARGQRVRIPGGRKSVTHMRNP
jgi:hypothetical protein